MRWGCGKESVVFFGDDEYNTRGSLVTGGLLRVGLGIIDSQLACIENEGMAFDEFDRACWNKNSTIEW